MPGLDRTGPQGAGPMTGGRRGLCGSQRGRGIPGGMVQRPMFRRRFSVDSPVYPYEAEKGNELALLHEEATALKTSIAEIERRIQELEKKG